MEENNTTKRIAKNTLMLYFRQILIMIVSLYTVRVVLNTLGAEDYGIYNVVAGVVTMFSFLSGAMTTACQRYFSFALGKNDEAKLKETFGITITVFLLFVGICFILAETFGLWFLKTKLVIPENRMIAAVWVYHFSVITFLITILNTPFMASIVSHEEMNIYAYFSIIEVILKLIIVFVLQWLFYDKLIVYGILLLLVAIINTSGYRFICRKKFIECRTKPIWNIEGIKEISSFIGWNFFGSFASVVKNQGYNVFVNLFFGPVVNAAQSVATQVRSAILNFSQNFSLAVRPQIIKQYAAGEYTKLQDFLIFSCKITFFLMLIIVVPIYNSLDFLLLVWLKNVPEYTVIFVKLLLLESLIESISFPMASLNQATGKIALYQFLIGITVMLNLPFTYIVLKLGYPPFFVYVGGIIFVSIISLIRLIFLKQINSFSIKKLIKHLIIPLIILSCVCFFLCTFISFSNTTFLCTFVEIFIKVIIVLICIFFIGFNKEDKHNIIQKIKVIIKRGKE